MAAAQDPENPEPDRKRLLSAGAGIRDAHRIALETQSIGAAIIGNLDEQFEQTQRTRTRLRTLTHDLGGANRTLARMYIGVKQHRVAVCGIIHGALVIIVLVVVLIVTQRTP